MLIPAETDRALSLLQPWATLAAMGVKTVETRSWRTAYRGPLLVHASSRRTGREFAALPQIARHIPDFNALPFGAFIGVVWLEDVIPYNPLLPVIPTGDSILELGAFGEDKGQRWAFILRTARLFDEPIPAQGKPGIFRV